MTLVALTVASLSGTAAYRRAEVPLRAVVEAGGRCVYAEVLGWIERVASVCDQALAAQLPWDQAAAPIYIIPAIGLPQILEEMRRQTSRAALQLQNAGVSALTPLNSDTTELDQYVTLDQAAALVNRSKKTLERYLNHPKSEQERMPSPDVEGGGGSSHEWRWSMLRPWLERTFGKQLPEQLPTRTRSSRPLT